MNPEYKWMLAKDCIKGGVENIEGLLKRTKKKKRINEIQIKLDVWKDAESIVKEIDKLDRSSSAKFSILSNSLMNKYIKLSYDINSKHIVGVKYRKYNKEYQLVHQEWRNIIGTFISLDEADKGGSI